MPVEILDQTKSELGEGPTYDRDLNTAWWFDIEGRLLFEHNFETGETTRTPLPRKASMLGVIDETTQLVAMEDGLFIRDRASGALTLHQPLEADDPVTRSNDGRVHPSGAIWIGTMGHKLEQGVGAIYHFLKGRLTRLYSEISIPNAICFTPDAASAYFTDTMVNTIMKVPVDPGTGLPTAEPEPFYENSDGKGGLDGAVTDAEGNLWVAVWGASCLKKISPEGELLERIELPVSQPSCPCFVGPDLDRILVTSAWQNRPELAIKGDLGKTLLVDVEVSGKAEPRVIL